MARIATVEEAAPAARIRDTSKVVDTEWLQLCLDAAEDHAESYCGVLFSPDPPLAANDADTNAPVLRTFPVASRTVIRVPGLRSATSVSLDGVTLMNNVNYRIDALTFPARFVYIEPYRSVSGDAGLISITGRWGYNPSPPRAKMAILSLAARWYHKRDALHADVVGNDMGTFTFAQDLPSSVQMILNGYRTPMLGIV